VRDEVEEVSWVGRTTGIRGLVARVAVVSVGTLLLRSRTIDGLPLPSWLRVSVRVMPGWLPLSYPVLSIMLNAGILAPPSCLDPFLSFFLLQKRATMLIVGPHSWLFLLRLLRWLPYHLDRLLHLLLFFLLCILRPVCRLWGVAWSFLFFFEANVISQMMTRRFMGPIIMRRSLDLLKPQRFLDQSHVLFLELID
jgi:hypothetical protein